MNVKLVMGLQTNVKRRANNADKGAGLNKRKIIEKAVMDELCAMLSTSAPAEQEKKLVDLKKGQPNVVMFVGLQARASPILAAALFFMHACAPSPCMIFLYVFWPGTGLPSSCLPCRNAQSGLSLLCVHAAVLH